MMISAFSRAGRVPPVAGAQAFELRLAVGSQGLIIIDALGCAQTFDAIDVRSPAPGSAGDARGAAAWRLPVRRSEPAPRCTHPYDDRLPVKPGNDQAQMQP
jgi:hypothetical protein